MDNSKKRDHDYTRVSFEIMLNISYKSRRLPLTTITQN